MRISESGVVVRVNSNMRFSGMTTEGGLGYSFLRRKRCKPPPSTAKASTSNAAHVMSLRRRNLADSDVISIPVPKVALSVTLPDSAFLTISRASFSVCEG